VPLVNHCRRLIPYLLLSLFCFSTSGQAANARNALNLEPASTLIAILDKEHKLSWPGNQRLFKAAGFAVEILNQCSDKNEPVCVRKALVDLRQRSARRNILFMTTGQHTKTVYSLFAKTGLKDQLAGVVLFRAQNLFEKYPPLKIDRAPPLLVFAKKEDDRGVVLASRRFADHMRRGGVWSWFTILPEDNPNMSQAFGHPPVIKIIYQFIGAGKDGENLYDVLAGHARWQQPPLNHDGFYEHAEFIKSYPIDDQFMSALKYVFASAPHQLKQWEFTTFKGFDVLAYRDKNKATKHQRYLVLRNHLGHFYPVDLDVYGKYQPLIVTGIGYETNLFRINSFYRLKASYSWIDDDEPPKISVKPLGAFLHFQIPLPKELQMRFSIRSALSFAGVEFADQNPLASLQKLSPSLQKIMTRTTNCIHCHSLDGVGGRAHHLSAATAEPQPGFALPLRSYSKDVLHNFFYDQEKVAAVIGVTPNPVPEDLVDELFEFLTADR